MKPNRRSNWSSARIEVLARGYRAMKVVIIPYTHYTALLPQVDRTARMMGALRDAVGPDIEIMVDFHGRPASAGAALAYIDAIEPARPMFVEEVLPPGDSLGLREVASKTSVPIATGERLIDLAEFDDLFRHRAISIAQPDICHCGGLWETKKIAAMAEAARHRRRPAQSDRPDRRRRRAALRRVDVKPCDPGRNGRRRPLVF